MLFGAGDQKCQMDGLFVQRLPLHPVLENADGDEEVLYPAALDVGDGDVLADARGDDVFPVEHGILELLEVDDVPRVIGKLDQLCKRVLLVPRRQERDALPRDVVF